MKKCLFTPLRLSVALAFVFSGTAYGQATFTEDAEYYASGALPLSNAAEAYRLGFTGNGVTIGVHDQPINFDSPEFSTKNKSITRRLVEPKIFVNPFDSPDYERDFYGDKVDPTIGVPDWSLLTHGTHVSSLAAASRNGLGMQGVAFDAQIKGGGIEWNSIEQDQQGGWRSVNLYGDPYLHLFEDPSVKIINMSWGDGVDWDNYFNHFSYDDVLQNVTAASEFLKLLPYDKLLVIAAGNAGWAQGSINSTLGWLSLQQSANKENYTLLYNNVLSVGALNNLALRYDETTGTIKVRDGVKGSPILTYFSNGAKYAEDMGIVAAGNHLMSANSAFKSPGAAIDIPESGTSMSAPVVTGAEALVQQAFPYLTSKQIGDVLLSTASTIETKPGEESYMTSLAGNSRYLTQQSSTNSNKKYPVYDLNVYYFDSEEQVGTTTRKELLQAAADQFYSIAEVAKKDATNPEQQSAEEGYIANFLARMPENVHVRAYYNTPLEVLVGAGAVNAGRAVRGLGALNARRMTPDDKLTVANFNTQFMDTTPYSAVVQPRDQMIYTVNTQGYNSTWSNDIKEVREGRIAADSTQADLARRYEFYRENWIDRQPESGWKAGSKYAGKTLREFARDYTRQHGRLEGTNESWGAFLAELQDNINLDPTESSYTKDELISNLNLEEFDPSQDYSPPQAALSALNARSLSTAYTDLSEGVQTQEMLDMYNNFVQEHQLENLPVGLHKQGAGILTLAGKNTYQGDTIVSGGGLNITGAVLGDVYSLNHGAHQFTPENIGSAAFGTVMGTGIIGGTLVNNSLVMAGNTDGTGSLTMRNLVSTPASMLLVYASENGERSGQFIVSADEELNPLANDPAISRSAEAGVADVDKANIRVMSVVTPQTYTVVKANKIKGKAVYADKLDLAFMEVGIEQDASSVKAVFKQTNRLIGTSADEQAVIDMVHDMYNHLPVKQDKAHPYTKADLRAFYQLTPEQGLQVAQDLTAPSLVAMSNAAQMSTLAAKNVRARHMAWNAGGMVNVTQATVQEQDSAEGDNASDANAGTLLRQQFNRAYRNGLSMWVDLGKQWHDVDNHFSGHQSSLSLGMDKGVGAHWRVGSFGSYTYRQWDDAHARDKSQDWRIGLYGLYQSGRHEADVYADYGVIHHDMKHNVRVLGWQTTAKPKGHLFEVGGEYRYRAWENSASGKESALSPYVNVQVSRYTQKAYSEEGAGLWNRQTRKMGQTYAAAEVGLDFQHQTERGQFGVRVGYKQVLAGAKPKLSFHFEGADTVARTVHYQRDRHTFVASLQGGYQLTKQLSLAGRFSVEMGKKELQLGLGASLQYRW